MKGLKGFIFLLFYGRIIGCMKGIASARRNEGRMIMSDYKCDEFDVRIEV